MEKDRNKPTEPYPPDATPKPPQEVNPEARKDQKRPPESKPAPEKDEEGKSHERSKSRETGLLSDQADIHDETTI